MFLDSDGFAGQCRFIHLELSGIQQPQICWNLVAGFEQHDIAWHQVAGRNGLVLPVAQHHGFEGSKLAQGCNGLVGPASLRKADRRIEGDDGHDHQCVLPLPQDTGHDRSHQQDDGHEILELIQQQPDPGVHFGSSQFVGATCVKALVGFCTSKS